MKDFKRVRTPSILQLDPAESGAASLGMILGHYGKYIPLEELREQCGVSRNGTKAEYILNAARDYGLQSESHQKEIDALREVKPPYIVNWSFNHFVVVEGFKKERVYLNDPATGPRKVSTDEFYDNFTGSTLQFEPTDKFKKGGRPKSVWPFLKRKLTGSPSVVWYLVFLAVLAIPPGLIIPIFSKIFIDNILIQKMNEWLWPLLIGMGTVLILNALIHWLQLKVLADLQVKLAVSSGVEFFWHILRLPMLFYLHRDGGDISGRVRSNQYIAEFITGRLAPVILLLLSVFFFAIVMFFYDVTLTILGISLALVNLLALSKLARLKKSFDLNAVKEMGQLQSTTINGVFMIETLKAIGRESDFFQRWAGYAAKALNAKQKIGYYRSIIDAVPLLLSLANTTVILLVGGFKVMSGELTMGALVAFQILMQRFSQPIDELVRLGGEFQELESHINRVDDVMKNNVESNGAVQKGKEDLKLLRGTLEINNVTFGYNRQERPFIENFNLSVGEGQSIAIVGPSGCGKSTLAKLVMGIYKPWSGEILFDNHRKEEIVSQIFSTSVSMVDQDIFIFEGKVNDVLTLWDPSITENDLVTACKDAVIHDDIAERAGGYDSIVSEGGMNFSGGQRQRLEIARALVNNPSMLILDEATSALDVISERIILENFKKRNCTCLIIAHRLSTIRDCDQIIVMDQGKIVQQGTHEGLIGAKGYYQDLVKQI